MLTNIQDVENWLIKHTNLTMRDFDIVLENDVFPAKIRVDVLKSICVKFENNEIPVKFGVVDGDFEIDENSIQTKLLKTKPLSLDFLPVYLNGNLNIPNLPLVQESFSNWNVKEISGYINICGKDTNLTNLNFLKNTEFDSVFLKVKNTPFEKEIIPEELDEYIQKIENKDPLYQISHNDLMEIINKNSILDYFDFDNNNLEMIR